MQNIDKISLNFILSTERAGSTLLTSMLNMNPEALATIEEPFAYNLYKAYSKIKIWDSKTIEKYCNDFLLFSNGYLKIQFGSIEKLKEVLIYNQKKLNIQYVIKLTYLEFFPNKKKDKIRVIVDKQLHFHHHLNSLNTYFPKSKFIVLVRDPRDNVILKQELFTSRKKNKTIYALAKSWEFIFGTILLFLKKIENDRYLIVKYEDLVKYPEIELNKVCNFLNIAYCPEMINFQDNIKTTLNNFVSGLNEKSRNFYEKGLISLTKKIDTNKVGIWENKLPKESSDLIWTISSKIAKEFGYEDNGSKKIFYSNFLYKDFYLNYIFKKKIITNIYKFFPYSAKIWIKNNLKRQKNDN